MAAFVLAALVAGCFGQGAGEPANLALGRPYTLKPRPNYHLCTDPGDKVQLTDGKYVEGYFWVQKGTVGWVGANFVDITVDLGAVKPISGVAMRTAAGVAGVQWPLSVTVFASDDGKKWYRLCDLITEREGGPLPPYGTYHEAVLENRKLRAHGRFVRLIIRPNGAYTFTDEIKVFAGPDGYLQAELAGEPVDDPARATRDEVFTAAIRNDLAQDIEAVRRSLQAADLADDLRRRLAGRLEQLAERVAALRGLRADGFRAIVPYLPLQRDIYRLQAEIWRAEGKPALRVWHTHRWAYIPPNAEPPGDAAPELSVSLMNGEVRGEVVNVTSAAPEPLKLRMRIEGLPGGTNPGWVQVAEVLHVATRSYRPVPAALPAAERDGGEWVVTVHSGMVRQIWLQFRPDGVTPGTYRGRVVIQPPQGRALEVPLRVRISRLRFPRQRTMLLGGWSYTDGTGAYGVTPQNRDEFIRYLIEHGVNAPWATRAAMPDGSYDDAGNMVQPPNTARFDEWVAKWRGARMYMVFIARGTSFAGAELGSDKFNRAVGNWAKFWADHMRELGLEPSQLGLLIYDEPHDQRAYELIAAWAKAIKAAAPQIQLFEDPTALKPDGLDTVARWSDILCPNRPRWIATAWYEEFFGRWRDQGKRLWFYSCSGPVRSFDPYLYYVLQHWHLFSVGGVGSAFWAFGDNRQSPKWNDFVSLPPGPYCPMYLGRQSVTNAKWMEAIREGAEDYEYLAMVRQRIRELGNSPAAAHARETLSRCVRDVLATAKGQHFEWNYDNVDHWAANRARRRLLRLLESL